MRQLYESEYFLIDTTFYFYGYWWIFTLFVA